MAKKGDVLLWHAFFVHGGGTIVDPRARRRSMACHYFSGEGLPASTPGLKVHGGNAFYMTKGVPDPV
jgi:hypothetical protein